MQFSHLDQLEAPISRFQSDSVSLHVEEELALYGANIFAFFFQNSNLSQHLSQQIPSLVRWMATWSLADPGCRQALSRPTVRSVAE